MFLRIEDANPQWREAVAILGIARCPIPRPDETIGQALERGARVPWVDLLSRCNAGGSYEFEEDGYDPLGLAGRP